MSLDDLHFPSLDDAHHLAEVFFNRLLRSNKLVKAMERFATGEGYSPVRLMCYFPSELARLGDLSPDAYDKIKIEDYETYDVVLISFDDFAKYLAIAVDLTVDHSPEQEKELRRLYDRVAAKLAQLGAAHTEDR